MLRYLKRLEDRDVALNRSMIPLGRCTMKLNATAEMMPITLPGFSDMHPFAPADQTAGLHGADRDACGMAVRRHRVRGGVVAAECGQPGRVCRAARHPRLSRRAGRGASRCVPHPVSAHGTNPASAAMAGYRVVVVACDRDGNIDSPT